MKRAPLLLFLAWLSVSFYSGIWLFMSGFLLMRIELNNQSLCSSPPSPAPYLQDGRCWFPQRFDKAVIVIIDALKYDFAKYNTANVNPKPYENKLGVIQQLITSQPQHARLYPFRADPPTTTMQRIKGFTTGSLPTFVDVGSNFASYAIQEDNLIHQMVQNGKRVVFMGDDTWDGLFPKKFYKSYFFPSFNVKDLHTVDDGILQHLYPTVDGGDWDVVITHFLGVDHCGHKHGPDHPETAKKLMQMNQVITSLIEHLDDKTLLVVAGDHGMTDTGDHGGDSEKEVTAALFLYSKASLFADQLQTDPAAVPQVNLVPSLSLLLGIPIPYSNLGAIIEDLFGWPGDKRSALLSKTSAYHLNAQQVARYLDSYSQAAGDLPSEKLRVLADLFSSLTAEYEQLMLQREQHTEEELEAHLQKIIHRLQGYLNQARNVCMESWARFHPLHMVMGCVILLTSCFFCYIIAEAGSALTLPYKYLLGYPLLFTILVPAVLGLAIWTSAVALDLVTLCAAAISVSQISFYFNYRTKMRWRKRPMYLLLSVPCVVLLFRCCSLFSDSYVVAEGKVAPFLLTSLLTVTVVKLHWDGKLMLPTFTPLGSESLKPSLIPAYRKDGSRLLWLLAALGICVRLSGLFHNCREETPDCQPSSFLSPLSSVQDPELKNFSYVCCVVCLGFIVFLIRKWLQHYGNLNSSSALVLYVRWGLPLIVLGIACYWALSSGTEDSFAKLRELTHLALVTCPRAIYAMTGLGILLVLWNPITVFMKSQVSNADNTVTTYRGAPGSAAELQHVIPQIYRKMQRTLKSRLEHAGEGEDGKKGAAVEAYGLGSVYSASMVITISILTLVLILLHSERMTPAFLLLLLEAFVILHIHGHIVNLYSDGVELFGVPWYAVLAWSLAASQNFYSTGHQPVFPAIHWNSAFVGFQDGHTNNIIPALIVAANTFSANILFSAGSGLLLLWPFLCEAPTIRRKKGKKENREGEMEDDDMPMMEMRLREDPDRFSVALLQLGTKYLFIQGVQLLSCVCAAMILRRHLMVWKVFAPKFLFEGLGFAVSSLFLILGIALILRVDCAVSNWFKNLIIHQSR
ncbi:GPI ethanolamine phosphate transferase 3, catalytic subunit isoform X2 [Rhinoderma darwinii]